MDGTIESAVGAAKPPDSPRLRRTHTRAHYRQPHRRSSGPRRDGHPDRGKEPDMAAIATTTTEIAARHPAGRFHDLDAE